MNQELENESSLTAEHQQAFMAVLASKFKIVYLFPHPKQNFEDASPFGWYTPGILATARPMLQACTLPADLREAHADTKDVLLHRLIGTIWPHLLPVEIDSLEPALAIMPSPFIVCVTTDFEVAARTDLILSEHTVPILHVSNINGLGRTPSQGFDFNCVCAHVRKVLDVLALRPESALFARECRRLLTGAPQRKLRNHPLRLGLHNITAPNETALAAFGYKFAKAKAISKPIDKLETYSSDNYVNRICQSADAVAAERARLLLGRTLLPDHRMILAIASSYARLYSTWQKLVQRAPEEKRRDLRHALTMVVRSSSYSHAVPTDNNGKLAIGPFSTLVANELSGDMLAFTSALGMLTSATLCPVLRLEPKLNQVRGDTAELARCIRSQAGVHYAWKQARMMRLLGQKMKSLVHPEFLQRIDAKEIGRIEGLKLITDLPLELLPSNGIPLALRFDTSRISPPARKFVLADLQPSPSHFQASAFYNILIVRSFKNSDPIRSCLEQALRVASGPNSYKRVKYRFIDVNTSEQFIDAVKNFEGAVMIFDGHGRYDAELGIGRLIVGGIPLDTWALKRLCQLPPVVMFSACDTQPIEGNHGSVATAAFALGARAVLGTMLPVDAIHSSVMMARMLLRIDEFLPIASTLFPVLTWRHVVSGMLRMSHATEASMALNAHAQLGLTTDALSRVQMKANVEINSWMPSWFDTWIEALAKESSRSSEDIMKLLKQHVGITDAMKYVQLGNPERLIIH